MAEQVPSLYNPLPSVTTPNTEMVTTVKNFLAASDEGAIRAAFATGNTCSDSAVRWGRAHSEDPDFNDPVAIPEFEMPQCPPLFSFGVIADVQYADADDGKSFSGATRHFRRALELTRRAVSAWNNSDIRFIAQLGDLIDGRNKDAGKSDEALNTVLAALGECHCKTMYSMVGNHELYNHSYAQLAGQKIIPENKGYYAVGIAEGWRLLVLNGFDVSTIGWGPLHPNTKAAWKLLDSNNPNDCRVEDGSVDWTGGLEGLAKRFVPFNGAIGDEQLLWLNAELEAAAAQKVLVTCHVPVQPGSCADQCLMWNFDQVLEALHRHGNVVAYLAGHDHDGGYARDCAGVHHVTFKSPLEAPPPNDCFATVEVQPTCLLVHGAGTQNSYTLPF